MNFFSWDLHPLRHQLRHLENYLRLWVPDQYQQLLNVQEKYSAVYQASDFQAKACWVKQSAYRRQVEELVGDSAEVSKLDGAVGPTAFDRSGLPFVVE